MQTILVIDDNAGVCQALEVLFSLYDLRTLTANSPEQGLALLREEPVELVIQDMNFSRATTGEEGLDLLARIKERRPELPVVLITAWGSIELAVAGMKG